MVASIPANRAVTGIDAVPSVWAPAHLQALSRTTLPAAALIGAAGAQPVLPDLDLWDLWPLQLDDGSVARIAGGEVWMILSAPRLPDPGDRHDVARTRLLHRVGNNWRDCGNLFPDGHTPGSREWSGSARYNPATGRITAYFTAAGRAGEAVRTMEQRLFQTTGQLVLTDGAPRITDWQSAEPCVVNDGRWYIDVARDYGRPGAINGFRDPYWFRDPADGRAYILFTGSLPGSPHLHKGVIGLAEARDPEGAAGFAPCPPIVSADGLCNELERPHMFVQHGLYYLFWSSHDNMFSPEGANAPTGLFGMVGTSVRGPFKPLNGTGLVVCNPAAEPRQAYCWQVLPTLEVCSFVDHWGLKGRDPARDASLNRAQFGGTIAPMLKLALDGTTTKIIAGAA
jgi:levansucrase